MATYHTWTLLIGLICWADRATVLNNARNIGKHTRPLRCFFGIGNIIVSVDKRTWNLAGCAMHANIVVPPTTVRVANLIEGGHVFSFVDAMIVHVDFHKRDAAWGTD